MQIRSLISVLALSLSVVAVATPASTVITTNKAVLHLCARGMMGCAPRIEIDNVSYLLELVTHEAHQSFIGINGAYQFYSMLKTLPGTAVGKIVREKGHFPNPTVYFEVFKAESLKYNLPG